jgi:hypothetical protein
MPPKKKKIWEETYQDLIEDYGIFFKGPTQPSVWPPRLRHLFEVIRDISLVRYDRYKKSEKLTTQAVRKRRRAAINISEEAHRLRYGRFNETTWRGLEAEVMGLFREKAVW